MAERRGGGVRRWYAGWTLWMVSASAAWAIPAFDEVRADFKPSDTLILSREGEVLQRLRKDQILEAYLNLVPFRSELVGIDALSRTLFGKAAHGLDDREAAVAAALVRAPNARPALVAQRACGVLRDMQATSGAHPAQRATPALARVDCDALDLFTTAALQRRAFDASEGVAPHFARYLLRQRSGKDGAVPERVPSTLRAPLQRFAVQSLQQ